MLGSSRQITGKVERLMAGLTSQQVALAAALLAPLKTRRTNTSTDQPGLRPGHTPGRKE